MFLGLVPQCSSFWQASIIFAIIFGLLKPRAMSVCERLKPLKMLNSVMVKVSSFYFYFSARSCKNESSDSFHFTEFQHATMASFLFFSSLHLNILKHFRVRYTPGLPLLCLYVSEKLLLNYLWMFFFLLLLQQPLRGVVILKQAIDKMQMNTNQLTSVHADLCQVSHCPCCLVAKAINGCMI